MNLAINVIKMLTKINRIKSHAHIINLRKGGVSVGHMTHLTCSERHYNKLEEALKAETVEPVCYRFL